MVCFIIFCSLAWKDLIYLLIYSCSSCYGAAAVAHAGNARGALSRVWSRRCRAVYAHLPPLERWTVRGHTFIVKVWTFLLWALIFEHNSNVLMQCSKKFLVWHFLKTIWQRFWSFLHAGSIYPHHAGSWNRYKHKSYESEASTIWLTTLRKKEGKAFPTILPDTRHW